ncbi:MAG: family peptidase [Burkholderia sp.]|jgi:pimeloyl-ACP methyl ester carboxylesterase|nr:family peptidase [Burkholderia sp.]
MVFLHGGPGLAYDAGYEPMTEWFLAHGYTVVAPEIAGSGKDGLENKSNSYTQNYVQDLKSVIHCLRERPDMQGKEFCAVAHSWGGFQLASLLTDEAAEERGFFKQVAFISPNLDSAQTRLFADASQYSDANEGSLLGFGRTLVRNFEERHTGNEEKMDESGKMTVLNNPLIDQSLNERFSPFYRLDKMPKDLPCLFFHATDDKQVPPSLSVDAFAKVNNAGGNASIVISSQGGHSFFKTGDAHQPGVMTNCFTSIDTLVKQGGSSKSVVIDGDMLPDSDIETVERRLLVADRAYENHTKALENFHNEIKAPETGNGRIGIPPKRELLEKIAKAHENLAKKFESLSTPVARRNAESNRNSANLINKSLEKT